jgi:membrane-bound lytic murein transglycosylase D
MREITPQASRPCAIGDTIPASLADGSRPYMHNNNDGQHRARRALGLAAALALSTTLAACQSVGTRSDVEKEIAPVTPEVVALADPLEPIALPVLEYLEPVVEPDLLVRLRSGFALDLTTDDPAVVRERDWYARNQAYLDRVFQRADRYLYYIVGEVEARDMPAELALLPIVESAFDPFAYSHGRAAGLWQIIPGTGRRLGLEQDWWFDGRRDVLEATRAALDYLEQLHQQFDGDWLLAVAGYNSGEGNVERALKKAAAAGRPRDFWGIKSYLPVETRTYVPRLLAVAELVADPAAAGVTLPALANEPHFDVVDTGGQIDMALAAELAGIDTAALYELNPGVNRWATRPEGPHRLLVPLGQADQFTTALAALGERELVQWTRHRVKSGETIGGIADRYQTTPAVLREINSLRGNTIRAGDYLMIPHALQSLDRYTQSADARAARTQSTPRNGERREHVVAAGESLWSISRAYDIDVRRLASWNSMAPGDVLSVGRTLVVWTEGPAQIAAASSGEAAVVHTDSAAGFAASNRIREITYVVRRGDSLSAIADRFHVTVAKLLEWNAGAGEKYLQPGQRLKLFVDVVEQSS